MHLIHISFPHRLHFILSFTVLFITPILATGNHRHWEPTSISNKGYVEGVVQFAGLPSLHNSENHSYASLRGADAPNDTAPADLTSTRRPLSYENNSVTTSAVSVTEEKSNIPEMGMGPPIPVGMPSGSLEGETGVPRREGKIHRKKTKVHRARNRVLNERNISQPRPKAAPGLSVDRKSSNALLVGEDLAKAELRDGLGSKVLVRPQKNDTVMDRVGSSVAILNPYGTQDIQTQPHVDLRSGEKSNPDAVEPKAGRADSIVINTGDEGKSHRSIANTSEAEGITSVEGPNAAKVSVSNAPDSVREVVEEEVQPTAADGRFKEEGSDDLERVASVSRVDDGTASEKSSESGNEMGISPSTRRMNSREGDGPTEIIVNNESSGEGAMRSFIAVTVVTVLLVAAVIGSFLCAKDTIQTQRSRTRYDGTGHRVRKVNIPSPGRRYNLVRPFAGTVHTGSGGSSSSSACA